MGNDEIIQEMKKRQKETMDYAIKTQKKCLNTFRFDVIMFVVDAAFLALAVASFMNRGNLFSMALMIPTVLVMALTTYIAGKNFADASSVVAELKAFETAEKRSEQYKG